MIESIEQLKTKKAKFEADIASGKASKYELDLLERGLKSVSALIKKHEWISEQKRDENFQSWTDDEMQYMTRQFHTPALMCVPCLRDIRDWKTPRPKGSPKNITQYWQYSLHISTIGENVRQDAKDAILQLIETANQNIKRANILSLLKAEVFWRNSYDEIENPMHLNGRYGISIIGEPQVEPINEGFGFVFIPNPELITILEEEK